MRTTGETPESSAISLDGLLRFLGEFRYDAVAESMLVGLIRIYGLSFMISPADKQRLMAAGASESLIKALAAAPTHIVAPPPPQTGFLSVRCQPLDCDVELNDRLIGRTSQGAMAPVTLPLGEAKVRAVREHYEVEPGEETVSIRSGATTNLLFRLALPRRFIESEGASLFSRIESALGTESFPAGPDAVVRATGFLNVKRRGADLATWSVVSTIEGPEVMRFQISRGGRKYDMALKNGAILWKKRPEDQEGRELEEGIRLALDYQLTNLMKRVKNPSCVYRAGMTQTQELDLTSLRVQADNASYTILIDSSSRPAEVLLESADLNGGTRVLFSRYTNLAGSMYPQETEVVLPGGTDGVALRFDHIERSPVAKSKKSFWKLARPLH